VEIFLQFEESKYIRTDFNTEFSAGWGYESIGISKFGYVFAIKHIDISLETLFIPCQSLLQKQNIKILRPAGSKLGIYALNKMDPAKKKSNCF